MTETQLKPAGSDPGEWDGTHIKFRFGDIPAGRKTCIWNVLTNDGFVLGQVKWFGRWRRYSFFPTSETVYEQTCLREIAQFIEDRTYEHRHGV